MSRINLRRSLVQSLVGLFPRLASMYRFVRDQREFMEEPPLTPWGFKLAGHAAMSQGDFEPVETELVRKILPGVDVFVNVGANVGYYCCHALSMGKPIIAFEPIERNFRHLCRNIKANGWSGAELYPIALSNKIDILEIYGGNTGASLVKGWAGIPESYVNLVPSSTMDIVLSTRLCGKRTLILVDIEGAERWMLEDASIMLSNNPKPIWIVEIAAKEHQSHQVKMNPNFLSTFEIFFQNGYEAFNINQSLTPITITEVNQIFSGESEPSTHNFLFREPK